MRATYRLIPGDQIWIVNTVDTRFNPVFVLAGTDKKYARELLANLNAISVRGGDASESDKPAVTGGRN